MTHQPIPHILGTLYFSNEDASHGCMGAHLLMGHRNKRVCLDKDVPAAPAEGTPQDLVVGVGLHLDSISIPPRIKAAEKEARDFKYRQALAGFFAGMATTPSKPSANPRKPSAAIEQAACSRAAMAQLQAPAKSQLINAVSKFISKRTSTSDEMDPANSSLAVLAHAMRPIDVALQDLEAVAPGAGVNKAEAFLAKHNVSAESLVPYVNATSKADEAMDCDGDNATSLQEGSSHQVEADASALAPAADEDAAPAEVEDVLARGAARVAPMYRRRQLAKAAAFRGVADPTNPEAQRIMKNWFFEHFGNPYPTEAERRELALRTNLTVDQVTNWFINQRGRIWKPLVTQLDAELVNEDAAEITTITTRTNKLVNEDADAHSGGAASG